MQNIDRDYAELIAKAPDAKSKAALVAQLEDVKKDITTARGRLLGMENVGLSPDSKMLWATRKARQANFIRFGSDFLVSSWTDPDLLAPSPSYPHASEAWWEGAASDVQGNPRRPYLLHGSSLSAGAR